MTIVSTDFLAGVLAQKSVETIVIGVGGDTSHLIEALRQKLPKLETYLLVSVEEALKTVPPLLKPKDIIFVKGSRGIELDRLVQGLKTT